MGQFDAGASATGYLYQCLYALHRALEDVFDDPNFQVGLETVDDVVFEQGSTPLEAIQVKHHSTPGNLTDRGADLWKTIRIWAAGVLSGAVPPGSKLILASTQTAAAGSIALQLTTEEDSRDVDAALDRLVEIASETGRGEGNEKAYAAFLELMPSQRRQLVNSIEIVSARPDIRDLEDEIAEELRPVVARPHREALFNYLTGWWWQQCVLALDPTTDQTSISGLSLSTVIDEIRTDLSSPVRLPRDPAVDDLGSASLGEYEHFPFVQALDQIEVIPAIKHNCVVDFLKASAQRSSWVQHDLVRPGELDEYDDGLEGEWKRRFDWMVQELTDPSAAEEVIAGRQLLQTLENLDYRVRDTFAHRFMARGSLHILADDYRIGWHPRFANLPAPTSSTPTKN